MKSLFCFAFLAILMSVPASLFAQDEDAEDCKDHPLFNRMPNFHISSCEFREFDAFKFPVENSTEDDVKTQTVEGKLYIYYYYVNDGATEPSALQVYRNYENALKKVNGTIMGKVYEPGNSYNFLSAKIVKGNAETWIRLDAGEGAVNEYYLTIVEKEAMVQVIQANDILSALNSDGYIALDILFETGKSDIKPESQELVAEISTMLNDNPSLKVSIEGHTDNVGDPASNKKLSDARAKAVVNALMAKGIAKERLSSVGWGQEKPVADNRTEEGRAKNRRVEIVKK